MKPTKCPVKKKLRQEKQKRRGGGGWKQKEKVKTAVSLLNLKTILKFCFLSIVHAWSSQAHILHLDQKAEKCTTCNQLCANPNKLSSS